MNGHRPTVVPQLHPSGAIAQLIDARQRREPDNDDDP